MKNAKYLAKANEDVVSVDMISQKYTSGLKISEARYADQVPAFDVTISALNEYGQIAQMRVMALEILNEGSGLSVDDIVNEVQMTYVARSIYPWQPIIRTVGGEVQATDIMENIGNEAYSSFLQGTSSLPGTTLGS